MSDITHGFTLQQSGNIGQEVISPRGNILAWTTDPIFGAFIVQVLNAIFSYDEPLEAIFEGNDIQAAAIKEANRRMTND
jgi:hypothetical protein